MSGRRLGQTVKCLLLGIALATGSVGCESGGDELSDKELFGDTTTTKTRTPPEPAPQVGGSGGDGSTASRLEDLRRLRGGERAYLARAATCRTTHAVLIAGDRPKPSVLELEEGDCVIWGNSGAAQVRLKASPTAGEAGRPALGAGAFSFDLPPGAVQGAMGPFEAMTRRAFEERKPTQCPSRGQYFVTAKPPVKIPYEIEPGGAKGMIVVRGGSAKAPQPEGRPTRELQAVRRLRCGEVTFAERPAACKRTRAVLIDGGKPTPRALRLPVVGGCVLWGNKGTPQVAVRSERGSSSAFFSHSALSPGSPLATSSDFFYGSSPGRIPYTIEPGRAKGAIVLE
jgi:hypothetical protein